MKIFDGHYEFDVGCVRFWFGNNKVLFKNDRGDGRHKIKIYIEFDDYSISEFFQKILDK